MGETVGVTVGVGVGEGEIFFFPLEGVGTVFFADGFIISVMEAEIGLRDRSTGLNKSGGMSMGMDKDCVNPGGAKNMAYRIRIVLRKMGTPVDGFIGESLPSRSLWFRKSSRDGRDCSARQPCRPVPEDRGGRPVALRPTLSSGLPLSGVKPGEEVNYLIAFNL